MSQRLVRVNELIKREISIILRKHFKQEAIAITITRVEIVPDLRNAKVFYTLFDGSEHKKAAANFFSRYAKTIRFEMGKMIVLKYLPHLRFVYDPHADKASQVLEELDSLESEDED